MRVLRWGTKEHLRHLRFAGCVVIMASPRSSSDASSASFDLNTSTYVYMHKYMYFFDPLHVSIILSSRFNSQFLIHDHVRTTYVHDIAMCRYCSNLYPKVESYRACNWCLKQEAAVRIVTTKEATTANGNDGNNGSSSGSSAVKLNRGAFPQHLNKAVKKQKVVQEASSSPNKTDSPGMRSEEAPRRLGKGKQVFRGKVRRYKLLEEVSS